MGYEFSDELLKKLNGKRFRIKLPKLTMNLINIILIILISLVVIYFESIINYFIHG